MHYYLQLFARTLVAMALIASSFSVVATASEVQTPAAEIAMWAQQSGVYRYRLGDFEITALSDGTVPLDVHVLLQGVNKKSIDGHLHHAFLNNPVEESVNAFVIDTGKRLVLVDTGAGDLFGPGAGGKLIANLRAAGYEPSQIDDVLLTHVHTDHSGGLIHNGKIVFSNAVIHVGKPDVDLFLNSANQDGVNGYPKEYFEQATACLTPYIKTAQLQPFSGPTQILPGIRSIPTSGHTPGHSFYRIESKGESITFIGDLVHVESMQFEKPKITIQFDVNQAEAAKQRIKQFSILSKSRGLVAGAHFPFPGIGHIGSNNDGAFRFIPVNYRNR
ncbi:MBL fold metallo-hydrolase [Allopusillimonas ginsengisoli]|uniref:MBL fold metallo-hydrolase n=1 Tax=Allopusillimonas ginsengisoli TaxID=453575 RepID=UPI0010206CE5|nr:MBL fold metallo-hydrolase [Allopusillimonas ginsengisoli]TEA69461.1 MBL fold metallo-hydrolase [Allopusillimonas ginsengisoli]